jgi:hypothetical protein
VPPASFEGIPRALGGSGVAVTAPETVLFFAKFSSVHLSNSSTKPRKNCAASETPTRLA